MTCGRTEYTQFFRFLLLIVTENSVMIMNNGRIRVDGDSGITKSSSFMVICLFSVMFKEVLVE